MSLLPYKVTALARVDNGDLNIIPGASVTVLANGGAYAQIYEADGTTPILNPFNCDENGERQIYLSGGSYTISVAGGQSWEIRLSGASDIQSVATIADLLDISGMSDGQTVNVTSYYDGWAGSTQPPAGGGKFVWSSTRPKSSHDGGAIISPTVPWDGGRAFTQDFLEGLGETNPGGLGVWVRDIDDVIDVTYYGGFAKDNGFDNRVPFQYAINAASRYKKTWTIGSTLNSEQYHIKSFAPGIAGTCLYIDDIVNFKAVGYRKRNPNVIYSGAADGLALLRLMNGTHDWGIELKDLGLDAGGKLDHCLLGTDVFYSLATIIGGSYWNAKLDGIRISLYMAELSNIHTAGNGRDGIAFCGPDSQGGPTSSSTTSITMTSCWARLNGRYGFSCENALWYSSFIACGVDGAGATGTVNRTQCAYNFYSARGVTLTACGAEQVDQYLNCDTFFNLTIDNPQTSGLGPTSGTRHAAIFLGGGRYASLTAMPPNIIDNPSFDYAVATNANTGLEKIDITDSSLPLDRCYFTPTAANKRWPKVFYFSGMSGIPEDKGSLLVGAAHLYPDTAPMVARVNRVFKHTRVIDNVSSTGTTNSVDLLTISGSAGPTLIQVRLTIGKFGGTPVPALGGETLIGYAFTETSGDTRIGSTLDHVTGSAYGGSLSWSGNTLQLQYNGQFSVASIEIEFWSRTKTVQFL